MPALGTAEMLLYGMITQIKDMLTFLKVNFTGTCHHQCLYD